MKILLLILLLALTVLACSKPHDAITQEPTQDAYFSKVRKYTDGRTPPTDTVWTLHLFTQQMVDSFAAKNGYVYNQTSTFKEVGVLWYK